MKRRTLIKGIPLVGVAIATPTFGAEPEDITTRLDRLTSELAEAMSEYLGGRYKVVVEPGPDGDVQFIKTSPDHRLHYAAGEIRSAMSGLGKDDFMVFVMDRPGQNAARLIDFKTGRHADI